MPDYATRSHARLIIPPGPLLTLRRPGAPKPLYLPAALLGFVTFIVMYHLCLNMWDS